MVAGLAASALAALPAAAGAASGTTLCPTGATCSTVRVPLDHSGKVPGSLALRVALVPAERHPATGLRKDGTLLVLPGGIGTSDLRVAAELEPRLGDDLESYDRIYVEQRGTGASGVACPPVRDRADVAACAARLGARRPFWTSREAALDLEDVRAAIGVEAWSVLGVGEDSRVAEEYAQRHPGRVTRLALDSPVPPDGLDVMRTLSAQALPRVLRELCFPPGCGDFLRDPVAGIRRLARRLERSPLRGRLVTPRGRTRPAAVTADALYALVARTDLDRELREELPAAVASGLAGDAQPLLALVSITAARSRLAPSNPVNEARLLATTCVEGRLPWSPESPLAGRAEALAAAYVRAPASQWAPFSPAIARRASLADLCAAWPPTPRPDPLPDRGPDLPVLVVSGRDDLRAPLEDARRTAARHPGVRLIAVPEVGHPVLANDSYACALGALDTFLLQPLNLRGPCPSIKGRGLLSPAPFVPASLRDLRPARGVRGPAARVVTAVAGTLEELVHDSIFAPTPEGAKVTRVPGLRGGSATITGKSVRLTAFEHVRGVRLTGVFADDDQEFDARDSPSADLARPGRLRVSAPGGLGGSLTLGRNQVLRGTLGGIRVRFDVFAARRRFR